MLWNNLKDSLKEKLPDSTHKLWIEPLTCLREDDNHLLLSCPDRFFQAWVMENYLGTIQESLAEVTGKAMTVRFSVSPSETAGQVLQLASSSRIEQLRLPAIPEVKSFAGNLHPRYTFEEFMEGDSNALAKSACQAIAKGDSSLGTSVFINAGTGLGKSHLTQAVAHYIYNYTPGTRLHYLTAQQFTAEMVQGIRANSMDDFKTKYHRNCDVLLIEDIHALTGKAKTQEELNSILDVLIKTGKRIILTSAYAPRELPDIDEGFRSRMAAGLLSTIRPPDLATRKRIILRKAANNDLQLSAEQVEYLAQYIKGDIRQVESCIVGIKAKSSLLREAPSLEMVKEVVLAVAGSCWSLTSEKIRDFVADQFNISVIDLQSRSRKKNIALPRQISMYLARKYTDDGLADIGRVFNRDHSTVLHSIRVITEAIARNSSIRGQVSLLADKLKK